MTMKALKRPEIIAAILLALVFTITNVREHMKVSSVALRTLAAENGLLRSATPTSSDEPQSLVASSQQETSLFAPEKKIPLYFITPSGRPGVLTRSIFHVQAFLDEQCGFDVHWIIVHSVSDPRMFKAPLFRNVFPWITELTAYHPKSIKGNYERNVAIEHVLSNADDGLVYFLDDDNLIPPMSLCRSEVRSALNTNNMFFGDVYNCNGVGIRFKTAWLREAWKNESFTMLGHTDTANWMIPVWLLREAELRWSLPYHGADGRFLTDMVKTLLRKDGSDKRLVHLPLAKFRYNCLTLCLQAPWTQEQMDESLQLFRDLVQEIQTMRLELSTTSEAKITSRAYSADVAFHEFPHILHVLRNFLPSPNDTANYVETGVWKGATSIFMSRHPLSTNVIGVDDFSIPNQLEEAEAYARQLKGDGTISWIQSDAASGLPSVQEKLNGQGIDILFLDGDHSYNGVRKAFEQYAPLLSEGGFVVFDDFMATAYTAGVREAVVHMIEDGTINLNEYDVIGSIPNTVGAGPAGSSEENSMFAYDWQSKASNEFVLRKKMQKREGMEEDGFWTSHGGVLRPSNHLWT